MNKLTITISDIINRILDITNSPQSIDFYSKAIKELGEGMVESEFSEMKYQLNKGKVADPAKYFTSLLQKQLKLSSVNSEMVDIKSNVNNRKDSKKSYVQQNLSSYFSSDAISLFNELQPSKDKRIELMKDGIMDTPYSEKYIHWATFVGPEFFVTSQYKAKSDRVVAKFRTLDDRVHYVPMIGGRTSPNGKEFGILRVEHGRILGAIEHIWSEQGYRVNYYSNGSATCYCDVSIRHLAKLLGWTHVDVGGNDIKYFKDKISEIKSVPYFLDLKSVDEFRLAGLESFWFYFFGDVSGLDLKRPDNGDAESIVHVEFSKTYSKQLLARRTVSRPLGFIKHRVELAFLIRLYLEPILMKKKDGVEHSIALERLIENLCLPSAGWHKYKCDRKRKFLKAVRDLEGEEMVDGRIFKVDLCDNLAKDDMILVSCPIKP